MFALAGADTVKIAAVREIIGILMYRCPESVWCVTEAGRINTTESILLLSGESILKLVAHAALAAAAVNGGYSSH